MVSLWNSLASWLSGTPQPTMSKKIDDLEAAKPASMVMRGTGKKPAESAAAAAAQHGSRHLYNSYALGSSTHRVECVVYGKEINVPVFTAASDEALKQVSGKLRCEEDGGDIVAAESRKERLTDRGDFAIMLSSLITHDNFYGTVTNVHDRDAWRAKFDNGYAVVVEVALQIDDERWDPYKHYVRAQVNELAPLHNNTVLLGDRDAILLRCLSPALANVPLNSRRRRACPINQNASVLGWCHRCNEAPNSLTLFETCLSVHDLFKYTTEILSHSGTHGHVMHAEPTPRGDANGVSVDDDDDDDNDRDSYAVKNGTKSKHTPSEEARIEVSPNSTLARDLVLRNRAIYEPSSDNSTAGVVFVARHNWHAEVASTAQRVLVNLPLANLGRASIRIAARGDAAGAQISLRMRLIVKCMAIHE